MSTLPPGFDYLDGSPGRVPIADTTISPDTQPKQYFKRVNSFIINNNMIQNQINDIVGKDIPFQELDEDERKKILLSFNDVTLNKVSLPNEMHYFSFMPVAAETVQIF